MKAASVALGGWLAFAQLAGPAVVLMLALGIVTGLLQTATQLRDSALPFIVKIIGLACLATIGGGFMMTGLDSYASRLLNAIPGIIHE
ncbi:flagellar biosynthetic protein FliQ [Acidisoma silvae]|uniref:Flagellar biosynthetic protein FliQ n=1 Tax=Acidisoma silvae TaxID=2802396 RepID=A0A963YPY0_9PROT|nr:flagellar biosynthetic protein FliQ [Acidisoma silvae]MCB8874916.1 flagellar biosynthetic protein FliQ [Acidisoma silvae]